jgi:hypothetical protein
MGADDAPLTPRPLRPYSVASAGDVSISVFLSPTKDFEPHLLQPPTIYIIQPR